MNNSTNKYDPNLHKIIISLPSKLYVGLYLLENTLKTQLVEAFRWKFGPDWLVAQTVGLIMAEQASILKRKPTFKFSDDKDLSNEASFGFWIEMFERKTFRALKGVPIKAFTNLPASVKRKSIYRDLLLIKLFRNNLYHHRMIFGNSSTEDLQHLADMAVTADIIKKLIEFLNPEKLSLLPDDFLMAFQEIKSRIDV